MATPTIVEFLYLRHRTWFPQRGTGTRTGVACHIPTAASAAIATHRGEEAPVAAVLSTLAGTTVRIRNLDGTLMRPVRRPGSWEECIVPDFRVAARGLEHWDDSPFTLGEGTVSGGARMQHMREGRWAAGEEDVILPAIVRRMGRLAVIDGIVHVGMGTPELTLRAVTPEPVTAVTTEWRDGTECDGSWTVGPPRSVYPDLFRGAHIEEGRPGHGCVTFGLDREDDAHRVGTEWARRMGATYQARRIVLDIDPGLIPGPVRDTVLHMLDELRSSFGADAWLAIHGQPRPVVEGWLDLRDMVETVCEAPTPDAVREVFERLSVLTDAVEGPDDKQHTRLNRLTVRWREAESRRDLAMVPGLDDEDLSAMPGF